jgi:hypothetical protein
VAPSVRRVRTPPRSPAPVPQETSDAQPEGLLPAPRDRRTRTGAGDPVPAVADDPLLRPVEPEDGREGADIAPKVDILLGNLEDAITIDNKEAARAGLVEVGRDWDPSAGTQLWTRVNALDSPWVLDDLTTLVTEIGDKLDVIMLPKVEGAEDIHYADRLIAQLEARAGLDRPILLHAILETARGVANVEEICLASPRMQGLSLGPGRPRREPADEDHPRRRRPPRLPRPAGPAGERRDRRGRSGDRPAGPVALHRRPDGRRLRDRRDPALLRALRRHQGHGRLRGPVPQRLPARLRRGVEPAPGPDRHREEGLLPRARPRSRGPSGSSRRWATAPAR